MKNVRDDASRQFVSTIQEYYLDLPDWIFYYLFQTESEIKDVQNDILKTEEEKVHNDFQGIYINYINLK